MSFLKRNQKKQVNFASFAVLNGFTSLDSKLSVLLRMILWSQNRLKEKTDFPYLKNLANPEFTMTNK